MAWEMCSNHIVPDQNVHLLHLPGLGIDVDAVRVQEFLVNVEIVANGKTLYGTPSL
jgi:hypothetical protein